MRNGTLKKATKIVATIGPATESEETLEQLMLAGMNVARFNTKHSTVEWHQERMNRVRKIANKLGMPIAILLDLQGPEIRITIPGEENFTVERDEEVVFTSNPENENPRQPIIPQIVIEALEVNNTVLIDDGLGEFVITKKEGDLLHTRALSAFPIGHRKTLNTPDVVIPLPSLIEQDMAHLDAASNELVDFVGLSFVRNVNDIDILKSELKKRDLHASIVAKIENQAALDNIDEIIAASDTIMVARGDLAVEVPFQELAYWQKKIILKCREASKPVITATQMLKSMVDRPRPTRAEVSDVANAVYDGTDAVMLSEETTIGKYPIEAVTTQATIVKFNEKHVEQRPIHTVDKDPSAYITHSAISLLSGHDQDGIQFQIDKLICLTETGRTAKLLSRFRPHIPIAALTSNAQTYRQLAMVHNVRPHIIDLPEGNKLESSGDLLEKIVSMGIADSGDMLLLIHGTFWKKPGLTNTMSLIEVP